MPLTAWPELEKQCAESAQSTVLVDAWGEQPGNEWPCRVPCRRLHLRKENKSVNETVEMSNTKTVTRPGDGKGEEMKKRKGKGNDVGEGTGNVAAEETVNSCVEETADNLDEMLD